MAFLPSIAKVTARTMGAARAAPSSRPGFVPPGIMKRIAEAQAMQPPASPYVNPMALNVGLAVRQPATSPFVRPGPVPMIFAPVARTPSPGATIDVVTGAVQSAFANTLPATPRRPPNVPATYGLGDSEDDFAQFGGFSLKGLVKTVGGAVTAVGHTIGSAVTSKVGQAVIGTGLALTGVGAPAAAAIFAATKGVGTLIKPGGNIKGALTGAAQGAVEGIVAANALNIAKGAVNVVKGAGGAVVSGAEKVLHIGGSSPAAPAATGADTIPGLNPAAMSAAIQAATGHAEDANSAVSQVAQQGNGIQAQIAQAQTTGNDAAVAQLQQAYLEQQQQLAAAQAAATAAQQAAQALQAGGGSLTPQQVAGYVGAAAQGSAAAQIAAAAPFTADGTAAAQQAADMAAASTMDAGSGQASTGGLLSHPMLLLGGLAAVVLIAGTKKRRRRAA